MVYNTTNHIACKAYKLKRDVVRGLKRRTPLKAACMPLKQPAEKVWLLYSEDVFVCCSLRRRVPMKAVYIPLKHLSEKHSCYSENAFVCCSQKRRAPLKAVQMPLNNTSENTHALVKTPLFTAA